MPLRVLVALLKRPGEIVTKEELKEKLWANDTFVDFDHSLSTAVNKIREALGDSATSPRFIETVPRKGYRFVGGAGMPQGDGAALKRLLLHLDPRAVLAQLARREVNLEDSKSNDAGLVGHGRLNYAPVMPDFPNLS